MGQHFEHLVEYTLAMCRECRHGVLPSQIKSHVQRSHHVKHKEAELIADEVRNWAGLSEYASELNVPSQFVKPIQQLPVYQDRKMCQLGPNRCRQIFQSERVMKNHWRDIHGWSPAEKGRRPTGV
jgi:hypothetical protein